MRDALGDLVFCCGHAATVHRRGSKNARFRQTDASPNRFADCIETAVRGGFVRK